MSSQLNNKYFELYQISKGLLKSEEELYNRIDEKLNRLLTVITILLGLTGFFAKWLLATFSNPENRTEYLILTDGGLLVLTLIIAWFVVLAGDRLYKLERMPIDQGMFDLFEEHKETTIYYTLSKGNRNALENNRTKTQNKISYLHSAQWLLIGASGLLIILLTSFTIYYL